MQYKAKMVLYSTCTCRLGKFSSILVLMTLLLVFESTSALNSENSFKNETSKNSPRSSDDVESMSAVLWGVSLGITGAIALVISLSCVYCSCCPLYRRRHRNRPAMLQQQQQQFPMTHQNLVYSYDSSGNLVLLHQPYQTYNNMTVSTVGSQAQMTATTNFYNPSNETTVPPSYDSVTATAPPPTTVK